MSEGRKVSTVIVTIFRAKSPLKMQSMQVSEKRKKGFQGKKDEYSGVNPIKLNKI